MRTGDLVSKLMGAGMIIASVPFFFLEMGLPALFFGIGGLMLVGHRDPAAPADPQLQRTVTELAQRLELTQSELTVAQKQLAELLEEREFMRQLTAETSRRVPPAGAGGAGE